MSEKPEYDYSKTGLTKDEYERRFWQRYESFQPTNAVGYGKDKPFIPPLVQPGLLITFIDRH